MPAKWLYQIGADGLLVTPDIMNRVRAGECATLRAINRQALTKLYHAHYSRPRRPDAIGLFYADVPPLELIPVVRGRDAPSPLLDDYVIYADEGMTKPEARRVMALVKDTKATLGVGQYLRVKWTDKGSKVVATVMKPNPKFDLVVVNRHDRAALLKLLSELDGSTSIAHWMEERTTPGGASTHSALHADYVAWCERGSEAPVGTKGFAQGLVAAGVGKLPRTAGGMRYELRLR